MPPSTYGLFTVLCPRLLTEGSSSLLSGDAPLQLQQCDAGPVFGKSVDGGLFFNGIKCHAHEKNEGQQEQRPLLIGPNYDTGSVGNGEEGCKEGYQICRDTAGGQPAAQGAE